MAETTGVGDEIRARRMRAGMDLSDLAQLAGVSRTTLTALEKGQEVRSSTIGKVQAALDRFEEEAGMGDHPAEEHGQVTFRLAGNFGIEVTVQGPVENLAELERSVSRLIEKMEQRRTE